jgi:hypothetical protein
VTGARRYAITDDGKRFLMNANLLLSTPRSAAPAINVVLNWQEDLKRVVPPQ